MKWSLQSRVCFGAASLALLAAFPVYARGPGQKSPPPAARQNRPAQRTESKAAQNGARAVQNQEHLTQWMENHKSLSLPDQQRALENEPGFRDLPPQVQQHELSELGRLYAMNPQQRSRLLQGNEALERMSPTQRQQFDATVGQFKSLPPDRKRLVTSAFRDLREMPQGQRQQVIDSPAFRAQFSDSERSTVKNLLGFEPYFAKGTTEPP
jgi:hypothetical protein